MVLRFIATAIEYGIPLFRIIAKNATVSIAKNNFFDPLTNYPYMVSSYCRKRQSGQAAHGALQTKGKIKMVPSKVKKEAEKINVLTVEEAKKLPGLLGSVVPAFLKIKGWYSCTVDGVKTLYSVS